MCVMDYWTLTLVFALLLLSGWYIACVSVRAFLWLNAEREPVASNITDVEQAARQWEAISTYHDLPDGSSVFLAVVAPNGDISVIKDGVEIERTAVAILQYRDERKKRWAILKHWRSACRPSTDS